MKSSEKSNTMVIIIAGLAISLLGALSSYYIHFDKAKYNSLQVEVPENFVRFLSTKK